MTHPKRAWVITMRRPVTAEERVVGFLSGRRGRRDVMNYIVQLHDHLVYTAAEQLRWLNGERRRPDVVYPRFFGPGAGDDETYPDQRSWGCNIGQSLLLTVRLGFEVHTVGSSEDEDLELVWTLVAADGSTETRRCDVTRCARSAAPHVWLTRPGLRRRPVERSRPRPPQEARRACYAAVSPGPRGPASGE